MGLDYRVSCCPDGLVTDRRRRIKVLDCTIRDGGICNDWQFSNELVQRTFSALERSGIDYMEIGYKTSEGIFSRDKVGPWRFCSEDDLAKVVDRKGKMKLSAMCDIGRITPQEIGPASESAIDVIRVACYAHQLDEALALLDHAKAQGYETFCNVMAVSTLQPQEVDAFLLRLAVSGVDNVALVDSFGALYPFHVRYLVSKYMNYLGEGIKVGVHLHNNQQQAFANTIAAIDEGVDFVDATIHGMGRGAGNCPLELLLFYLDNPRYDVQPVLELVDQFANLRDDLRWGYHLPYAMTGFFNIHPRSGIERMTRKDRYVVADMYEKLKGRLDGRSKAG
ncbi:MAG: aldolase catalytic domain-containing protein [Myxococcota bacterium]|nr:aldolase catalytic domain-containing protein [Myxococcota bacterium]